MNVQSFTPFLLLIAPFAIAFLLEALVIYLFKLKLFWTSVGLSVAINLLALLVLYGASLLMGKLGYVFSGLQLPVPVLIAFWWISVVIDGLLLQVFSVRLPDKPVYILSAIMNTVSYLFLYFFVTNSH